MKDTYEFLRLTLEDLLIGRPEKVRLQSYTGVLGLALAWGPVDDTSLPLTILDLPCLIGLSYKWLFLRFCGLTRIYATFILTLFELIGEWETVRFPDFSPLLLPLDFGDFN